MENRYSGKEFADDLAMFQANVHLPTIRPGDVATVLATLEQPNMMATMTPDMIAELVVQLNLYSWYLQQEINKLKSKLGFYKSNLDSIIGKNLGDTPYSFFGEKKLYIIANNEKAQSYDKHILEIEGQLATVYMYDKQIANLTDSLKSLMYTRKQTVGSSI